VTANDPSDTDAGSNGRQNFPVLSTATSSGGSTTVTGSLNSTANTAFSIEFFANQSCDPTGHGEGETFIGSQSVTTDAGGDASFGATIAVSVPSGAFVTSTTTDPTGNTSEFSGMRRSQ
jgi:hypothetical protein